MMVRRLTTTALALCLSAAVASTAQAQAPATCSSTGPGVINCTPAIATVLSGTMQRIIFLSVAPASILLTMPTDANFTVADTATVANAASQAVTVRSNFSWTLNVSGAWNTSKLITDFFYTTDAGSSWTPMLGTNQAVFGPGGAPGTTPLTIGYQTLWRLGSDAPGAYTQTLTFTLSAP